MYQKLVTKTTLFSCQSPFLAYVLTSCTPSFSGRGDRKGELPLMFWMQRNRWAFDIVTKILQGPPNTLSAGFLLKRHTWTQLRGNMIKQEKAKNPLTSRDVIASTTFLTSALATAAMRAGCCRGALLPQHGQRRWVMLLNPGQPVPPWGLQPTNSLPARPAGKCCFSDISSNNNNLRAKLPCHLPAFLPWRCCAETSAHSHRGDGVTPFPGSFRRASPLRQHSFLLGYCWWGKETLIFLISL